MSPTRSPTSPTRAPDSTTVSPTGTGFVVKVLVTLNRILANFGLSQQNSWIINVRIWLNVPATIVIRISATRQGSVVATVAVSGSDPNEVNRVANLLVSQANTPGSNLRTNDPTVMSAALEPTPIIPAPADGGGGGGLSDGAIAGIVLGVVLGLGLLFGLLWWFLWREQCPLCSCCDCCDDEEGKREVDGSEYSGEARGMGHGSPAPVAEPHFPEELARRDRLNEDQRIARIKDAFMAESGGQQTLAPARFVRAMEKPELSNALCREPTGKGGRPVYWAGDYIRKQQYKSGELVWDDVERDLRGLYGSSQEAPPPAQPPSGYAQPQATGMSSQHRSVHTASQQQMQPPSSIQQQPSLQQTRNKLTRPEGQAVQALWEGEWLSASIHEVYPPGHASCPPEAAEGAYLVKWASDGSVTTMLPHDVRDVPPPSAPKFTVGQAVSAKWGGEDGWFEGTILDCTGDTYAIAWDDGTQTPEVPEADIKAR